MPRKHMWEVDHPYYAADGWDEKAESFAELRAQVDAMDEDMNLVYRWDWHDASQSIHDGRYLDTDDRSKEELRVHILHPRKSRFGTLSCPITKAQEFEVLEWLSGPRCLGHLQKLWEPIMDALPALDPTDREREIWRHQIACLEEQARLTGMHLTATRLRAGLEPEGNQS